MRSLLIVIFSAVLTYGIPIHAQETIDANLPPVPLTHTRTLFIFPVVDQSNPLEDAEQNPTPSPRCGRYQLTASGAFSLQIFSTMNLLIHNGRSR